MKEQIQLSLTEISSSQQADKISFKNTKPGHPASHTIINETIEVILFSKIVSPASARGPQTLPDHTTG